MFLRVVLLGVACFAAALGPGQAQGISDDNALVHHEPPNVLIIMTDDQRARGTLRVMDETRRIFEEKGIRYPAAMGSTPLCCPGRATVMTGRYAHNHRVLTNELTRNLDLTTTLQHRLQDEGYSTAIAGKFLNYWRLGIDPPDFDQWAVFKHGYEDEAFNVNGTRTVIPGYSTTILGDLATDMLDTFENDDDRPWFLLVTPWAPHSRYLTTPKYQNARVPQWDPDPAVTEKNRGDKPAWVQRFDWSLRRAKSHRDRGLRALMPVDDMVAEIFGKMTALGEGRETLAFYTSDNGYTWGDHGLGGVTYGKRSPYLGSIGIPLMARWPERLPQGIVDNRLAMNTDIAPTILETVGVTPPVDEEIDGRSLLAEPRDKALLEYWDDDRANVPTWASFRTPTRHYIEYYGEDSEDLVFRELYRLRSDPWELHNVFDDGDNSNDPSKAQMARWHRRLAEARSCVGTACP